MKKSETKGGCTQYTFFSDAFLYGNRHALDIYMSTVKDVVRTSGILCEVRTKDVMYVFNRKAEFTFDTYCENKAVCSDNNVYREIPFSQSHENF